MPNVGYLADFKIGYLQRAIALHQASVDGGIDASIHDDTVLGFATRRLVVVTDEGDGTYAITAPTTGVGSLTADDTIEEAAVKVAAGLGDATHIVAQSDNSLRNFPEDYTPTERYNTRHDPLLKNDREDKTVSVYKIVNTDDINLINVDTITRVSGGA